LHGELIKPERAAIAARRRERERERVRERERGGGRGKGKRKSGLKGEIFNRRLCAWLSPPDSRLACACASQE